MINADFLSGHYASNGTFKLVLDGALVCDPIAEGKVHHFGLSEYGVEITRRARAIMPVTTQQ